MQVEGDESSYYCNKLFDLYDFKIHDKAANCQIVTIDRIIDAIVAITEQKLMSGIVNNKIKHYWRTTVLIMPNMSFLLSDSFIVNFQK